MDKEIVIKIHEKDYQTIKNGHIPFSILDAIKNGTPLPKGHGRLIDADALLQEHRDLDAYPFPSITIQNAPTIIEGSGVE